MKSIDEYIRIKKELTKRNSLCSLLQLIALDTWSRIEFGRTRKGLKVFETTVTQNILYELFVYSYLNPKCPIRMFEAVNESINGNDIELCIRIRDGYVIFPLQSKIIDKRGAYSKIEHKNQIEDLISYSKKVGGIPLYLLYNYFDKSFMYDDQQCNIQFNHKQYGCSLISAYFINNNFKDKKKGKNGSTEWKIPSFKELHPQYALPLFVLGCCLNSEMRIMETLELLNISKNDLDISEVKLYKNFEDIIDLSWKPVESNGINYNQDSNNSDVSNYAPKFRIVLN